MQEKQVLQDKITLVALVTLEDAGRFLLLMASLAKFARVSSQPGIPHGTC